MTALPKIYSTFVSKYSIGGKTFFNTLNCYLGKAVRYCFPKKSIQESHSEDTLFGYVYFLIIINLKHILPCSPDFLLLASLVSLICTETMYFLVTV
jgi:hypothetical protein